MTVRHCPQTSSLRVQTNSAGGMRRPREGGRRTHRLFAVGSKYSFLDQGDNGTAKREAGQPQVHIRDTEATQSIPGLGLVSSARAHAPADVAGPGL